MSAPASRAALTLSCAEAGADVELGEVALGELSGRVRACARIPVVAELVAGVVDDVHVTHAVSARERALDRGGDLGERLARRGRVDLVADAGNGRRFVPIESAVNQGAESERLIVKIEPPVQSQVPLPLLAAGSVAAVAQRSHRGCSDIAASRPVFWAAVVNDLVPAASVVSVIAVRDAQARVIWFVTKRPCCATSS